MKNKKKRILKISAIVLLILFLVFILIATGVTIKGYSMYKSSVDETPIDDKVKTITEQEYYTSIENLPDFYIDAVIATEDRRFLEHSGIDYISILRAFKNNIKSLSLSEGASTITQQLAKNMFFSQEKKFERKIAEVFMAFKLEEELEKDEILELYANSIYFGSGYTGIYNAAQGYFEKEPKDLTDYECAILAGLPNAPSVYSLDNNPELAQQRAKQVLSKMVKNGYISDNRMDEILKENNIA